MPLCTKPRYICIWFNYNVYNYIMVIGIVSGLVKCIVSSWTMTNSCNTYDCLISINECSLYMYWDWNLQRSHWRFSASISIANTREIQCDAVITRSIFSKIFTKTPHSSHLRARYGMSFVYSTSDWYSASIPAIICAISYYTEPCDNGTWLYWNRALSHWYRMGYLVP